MARFDSSQRFAQDDLVVMPIENPKHLKDWHSYIARLEFSSETEEMEQLKSESSTDAEYRLAFDNAKYANKNVAGLTKAECIVVTMYTVNHPSFYKTFNDRCRAGNWGFYKVFSALLFTACTKLNKKYPIKETEVLYRGLNKEMSFSKSGKFYWPQFTSFSMSKEIAEQFSKSSNTILKLSSCVFGARIDDLSVYGKEYEVLISPFEAFHFISESKQNGQTQMSVSGCRTQPFIKTGPVICLADELSETLSLAPGFKPIVKTISRLRIFKLT